MIVIFFLVFGVVLNLVQPNATSCQMNWFKWVNLFKTNTHFVPPLHAVTKLMCAKIDEMTLKCVRRALFQVLYFTHFVRSLYSQVISYNYVLQKRYDVFLSSSSCSFSLLEILISYWNSYIG